MEKIILSDEAYDEFKGFLDENKVESYNIRINFAGSGCSGPSFNISVGDNRESDVLEKVKDINFFIDPKLIEDYGIFTILSTDENDGRGLSLRPLIEAEGGCGGCTGCH
jgi:HesB-like selenoprotein